jgi:ABC-type transporter Mla MlaB component
MLRITVHDKPGALTFRLEGRLAGPWVPVLEECWQSALAGQPDQALRVDLTGVTSIDAAGRACLATVHRQGAEFVAADCLMKAVVAEITGAPLPDRGPLKPEAESRRSPRGDPASPRGSASQGEGRIDSGFPQE